MKFIVVLGLIFFSTARAAQFPGTQTQSTNTRSFSHINFPALNGKDIVSPLQPMSIQSTEIQNASDSALGRHVILFGGHGANDLIAEKHNCQNISGGDEGGVCYQFSQGYGAEWERRNGAGDTDGVNVQMDTGASSPLDVVGGGVPSADGIIYTVS